MGTACRESDVDLFSAALPLVSPLTVMQVMTTQSLAGVKARFSKVIDGVAGTHERVFVTRNGSPVAVILAVVDIFRTPS